MTVALWRVLLLADFGLELAEVPALFPCGGGKVSYSLATSLLNTLAFIHQGLLELKRTGPCSLGSYCHTCSSRLLPLSMKTNGWWFLPLGGTYIHAECS